MQNDVRKIKTAVITGPTGAIGTALCKELVKSGIDVIAVCRPGSSRNSAMLEEMGVKKVFCDMSEIHKLPEIIDEKIDAFFHLAWAHTIGEGRNDMLAQINNIKYSVLAVQVAGKMGCSVFIGAGSQAEYGRSEGALSSSTPCFPENGYGMAKLCAGNMTRLECQKIGIAHIWIRVLSIYGPGDGNSTMISSLIQQLSLKKKPALTEGTQIWDYLYSEDAAKAFKLAALKGVSGRTYVLGSGEAKPLKEYIETVRNQMSPEVSLGFGEVSYSANQVMHLEADISELVNDTGFSPEVSFEQGITNTIEHYLNKDTQ